MSNIYKKSDLNQISEITNYDLHKTLEDCYLQISAYEIYDREDETTSKIQMEICFLLDNRELFRATNRQILKDFIDIYRNQYLELSLHNNKDLFKLHYYEFFKKLDAKELQPDIYQVFKNIYDKTLILK